MRRLHSAARPVARLLQRWFFAGLSCWLALGLAPSLPAADAPRPGTPPPRSGYSPALRERIKAANERRKPNIVFILADDLGYGDLGCYGQKRIRTPNLDRLAAQGTRFTRCYAGSTVCAPSRACLLTGLHTGHVSIRGNRDLPLLPEEVTVAEFLKKQGYDTGCVGKWGLGGLGTTGMPSRRGFDEWFGYLTHLQAHDYYPAQLSRSSAVSGMGETTFFVPRNQGGARGEYAPDLFTKVATNFVRTGKYTPFFLYLAYPTPHANNELKEQGMQVPSLEPYGAEKWPAPEKAKAAMITRLDRDVGLVLDQIAQTGLEDSTVVFFSSDNGPHREGGVKPEFFESAGPLRGIKRDLYEGGIRVPMIVRWPGHVPAGTTNDQIMAFWDFLPTVLDIARVPVAPAGLDGISMLPSLLGQPQTNQHEFLYWEFHEGASSQAALHGDWKALRPAPGQALQLFNLKQDPTETNNVAAAEPGWVDRFEKFLATARTEAAEWPLRTADQQRAAEAALPAPAAASPAKPAKK